MESFRWDSYFMTGIAIVDVQHQHLVNMVNHFGELVQQQEGATEEDINNLLEALAAYAVHHFREEEDLMADKQVDRRHLTQHCGEHSNFLQEVIRMKEGMAGNRREVAVSLLKFLTHWLVYHILGSDQLMAMQVAAIHTGSTAEEAYEAVQKSLDPATAALLEAINSLFQQLSERNKELFELNQLLQARIIKRNQELVEANQRIDEMSLGFSPSSPSSDTMPWYDS
ncbi:MAG: hemerythrin family protein [Magnetococcales bacterium]|nr:hemerythrin family protein [Magnetococcales bacterium]MBF0115043.1 hemerythrin family protein [Magnetococcales bacterium]